MQPTVQQLAHVISGQGRGGRVDKCRPSGSIHAVDPLAGGGQDQLVAATHLLERFCRPFPLGQGRLQLSRSLEDALLESGVQGSDLPFGSLALDELADLLTDRRDGKDQIQIGCADLAGEELDHADDIRAGFDRERESAMQTRVGGRLEAAPQAVIVRDVCDRLRLTVLPGPAG